MKIEIESRNSYKLLKVKDERLDVHSTPNLIAELYYLVLNHVNCNFVLDISNCSYCDTSGLSAIQTIHSSCEKAGGMLILTAIQKKVEKLIKICMLDQEWNIAKDIDEVEKLLMEGDEASGIYKPSEVCNLAG